jgi:hypothetical protein
MLHIQIIVEIVFFGVILLLLWQMKRDLERYRPLADAAAMDLLKKGMAESQEFAEKFVTQMEENKQALSRLSRQLDEKEKRLSALVDQAEAVISQMHAGRDTVGTGSSEKRYDDAINWVRQGMSREEVSKQSGLTDGEIGLIMELSRARTVESP